MAPAGDYRTPSLDRARRPGAADLLLSLDMGVLYLALPLCPPTSAPSSTQQLWIMDVYGFMLAGFLITMGTLGDRIGRRRLLLIGAAAFGVASVLAAFSTSAAMLIAPARCSGSPARRSCPRRSALISTMFPDPRAARHRDRDLDEPASWAASRSARWSAACCWSTSGGARRSCWACR